MRNFDSKKSTIIYSILRGLFIITIPLLFMSSFSPAFHKQQSAEQESDPNSIIINDKDLGRIRLSNLKVPSGINASRATYTYSGKVLLYGSEAGNINYAIINDDGTGYREIWSGPIPPRGGGNGIRQMPFEDNKRILLGDYVLECIPDIDQCVDAKLIPIKYPDNIMNDNKTAMHWSEVIISPDNVHMAWTTLRFDGHADFIGKLVRYEDKYVLEDVRIISTLNNFIEDPEHEEYIIPQTLYGGEVKQFARGGAAITTVGVFHSGITNSMLQSLTSSEIRSITNQPGYEETTIISPDGKLGIVMSTRGSDKTNCAIAGLMPRPNSVYVTMPLIGHVYRYSVTGVRNGTRVGNIGPVLIDINKSMQSENYDGVQLNDPAGEWVYVSPISWKNDNRKGLWIERSKIGNGIRFRIAELLDYKPSGAEKTIGVLNVDDIPYAQDISVMESFAPMQIDSKKIAGLNSGYAVFSNTDGTEMEYVDYSDDGKNYYNGIEKVYSDGSNLVYEANVRMTGAKNGVMDFRLTFTSQSVLLFDMAEDGNPMSFGYSEYGGKRIEVSEMSP